MRWPWLAKAPTAVFELSDEQVGRWRENDQSVWDEDTKGRLLSRHALAERDRAERRVAGEAARWARRVGDRQREWEAGS
jgi:hypothetical protein